MNPVLGYLIVFIGGGIGSAFRHGANRAGVALFGTDHSFSGTLFVNVAGCLLIGIFAGWFAFRGETTTAELRLFLTTGLCGGFTTFSAFSLDSVLLWQRGDYVTCVVYVAASLAVSFAGILAGLASMRVFLS